ncbi:hypothetical protein E1B28_001596 [Marasmius oreades]|uniref:Uncharacterized protein n=1 Tax=Marasmius oreades TaxID=181124 RepID=A0A9P7V3X3_9AGAR|nr:uncharacterized protein E1B28_001596 [Marasmius oreades]KAG7099784.1 hypothetical protein E1B28_001596 [Marasmius oreades]
MRNSVAITTSSSTLMHTSLAYFSNEIRTVDAIISYPFHRFRHSKPILPREILLHIRSYLHTNVTKDLMMQSYSALQRYENTLRHLLCTECLSYNEYVYGDDLWQWEDFSGACRCIEGVYIASRPSYTTANASSLTQTPSLNPKRFVGRRQWLEYYLSRKSLRFIQRKPLDQSTPSRSQPTIWSLVRRVLHQYFQCVSIHDISPLPPSCSGSNEGSDILIVPVPDLAGTGILSDECTTKVKLERVERDLGLTVPYDLRSTLSSQMYPASPALSSTAPSMLSFLSYPPELPHVFRAVANVIPILCTVLITTISLPVSFLTLVLTLVCYYLKPRAFTILL